LARASTPSFFRCWPTPLPDRLRAFLSSRDVPPDLRRDRCRDRRGARGRCRHPVPLMRPVEAARTARQSQRDADAEPPELRAGDADAHAHGPRCPHALSEPEAVALRDASAAQSVSSAVRLSEHPLEPTPRWALVAQRSEQQKPEVLRPRRALPRLALRLPAPWPRGDDALRLLRRVRLARASRRPRERRSRPRAADESRPAERQHVRASHAPNERGCEQPDRHSTDSNGCAQARPFDEED
jgi:hypothetical protein